jgi:hypothetical protein
VADEIAALNYAVQMGAKISNNSYGGPGYSTAHYDSLRAARDANHLFVAAAGNSSNDNDTNPAYPASYDLENIISVAATDQNDLKAGFSNYGATTVDLGAPGVNILSCELGNTYGIKQGTSMASPHVCGAAALIKSLKPSLSYNEIKSLIMQGVDPIPDLSGRTVTGGRLNLFNSLPAGGGGGGGGGIVVPTGVVGYFIFDDVGETVEDFTTTEDWLTTWAHAGTVFNGTVTTQAYVAVMVDADGDGLPDWWEQIHFGADVDPEGDADGDGLNNLNEYLSGADPNRLDTDLDGRSDYDEDSDNDGLSNGDEQDVYGTDPGEADTDDDGFEDGDEVDWAVACPAGSANWYTDPLYSGSPAIMRSLACDGTALELPSGRTVLGGDDRYRLDEWTLECWVMPTNGPQTGNLIVRRTAFGQTNFALRLDANVPSVLFTTDAGELHQVSASEAIASDTWTHLAGVWDPTNHSLSVMIKHGSRRPRRDGGLCRRTRAHVPGRRVRGAA